MSHFSAFGNRFTGPGTVWTSLASTIFQGNRNDDICPEKTVPTAPRKPHQQLCIKLSRSHFQGLLLYRSLPAQLSAMLFARFRVRPASCIAPSQRSSPQAISTVSCPSSILSRSVPAKLATGYFHGFVSVPHAASLPPSEAFPSYFHGFLSVQHAVSLPPSEAFPKLDSTVSRPSSMLYRSLPAKLAPSYFHGFVSVQHDVSLSSGEAFRKLFARFRVRPACCIAFFRRSFPQAICTVSCPSSMLYRSLPAKLSPSYFHGFVSVQHAVSLSPSEAFPKLFPRFRVRPACCIAPSQRSFPQAICTVSCPSSMLYCSLPAKLSASYLHGFMSVQHAVSLPPGEAFRKLFARFRVRPACCIAPSQRSFPQAISTVSCPSSMLYRSLPAKLAPSYFHGFMSVQHAVSLPPSEAFPKLFARFHVRPACCLAPSQRSFPQAIFARFRVHPACCIASSRWSFPQARFYGFVSVQDAVSLPPGEAFRNAICTVSCPSSMLYRSLPAKLPASYLHAFVSVQHAVSLPPGETFRKLFSRFRVRPACCIAPSQWSFPQAICTVSCPSSMLYRSLPVKLSASYLHGFMSVQHAVSLPPGEAFPKLDSTVSCPSSMLYRSIPVKLAPS